MDDEDWDAEIDGTATTTTTKLQALSINSNERSSASKYFSDDYVAEERPQPFEDFGGHRGFGGNRGIVNGRGRGFGRGRATSGNWRNNDNSHQNGFSENGHMSRQNNSQNDYHKSDSNDLVIEVLNENIGKMIGKGGSKIREIQSTSGARVFVLKDEANMSVTPVKIIGSPEQQAKAEELINDCTNAGANLREWAAQENKKYEEQQKTMPMAVIDWGVLRTNADKYEKEKWADCPKIIKHFYHENKSIANMDPLEVAEIRMKKNNITVQDLGDQNRTIQNPILTFEDAFEQYPEILDTIRANKFTEPSPIQSQAWPVLLSGMDCIGIAQTGTGKTLAFLLPAFIHIDEQLTPRRERGGPSCLVLSPTRELAQQIEMEVKKYHYKGIRSVCIYGGGDRREQIRLVQKGVEIVIGTPGRLNDLLMNNFFSVKSVTYLILDEADRMLDMGFEPEIKKILLDIRPDRQTIMTSATWPPSVQRMADKYLASAVRVNVGSMDLQACHSVTQLVEFIDPADKQERVLEFITAMSPTDKLIIFVGRKVTADDISSNFAMRGLEGIQCIHGDRDQADREQALEDMKTGRARVLIATDVASRGLDIKDLTHVLNFDFPRHIEDYVHRIGRTGRAGRTGCALTFVAREDWMHVGKLIPILEEAGQEIPEDLVDMANRWQEVRARRDEERNMAGGGRGGGRSDGCFNCGQAGHMSRECPQPRRGGRGGFGGRGGGGRGGRRKEGGVQCLSYDAI